MATPRPIAKGEPFGDGESVIVAHRASQADEQRPRSASPVTHTFAALAFFTSGRSRMEQNGRWDVGAGDILLVPAGQPHRRLETQRSEYWGLSFCVPCFAADGAAPLLAPFERVRDGASAVVSIPAARHAFLESLFRELESLGRTARPAASMRPTVQRSLLTLVLNEVEHAAGPLAGTVAASGGVVVDSLRFIERNCLRKLTLGDVATAVGRSPAYVTSALSRATGRSAVAWIISGRIAEARRLLAHSDEAVDAIAARVGYADATHFIRTFRRHAGATPAAWRARLWARP
jgi:AraC family transcriptional activator of pobA